MKLLEGYGHRPILVLGDEPDLVHQLLAEAMDDAFDGIADIKARAAAGALVGRPAWPMMVLRTPKGWTGPAVLDGLPVEGTFRAHQVPLSAVRTNPGHLAQLETWLLSYAPHDLFTLAWGVASGPGGTGSDRSAADECEPTCERRSAAAGADPSRLPCPCRRCASSRQVVRRGDPGVGSVPAGRRSG